MKRICIIGGSGTGKTTLAKNLGKQLSLPVYYIDGIHHLKIGKYVIKMREIKLF